MTEIPAGSIWYDDRGVGIEVYEADEEEVEGLIIDGPDALAEWIGDDFAASRSRFLSQYEKQVRGPRSRFLSEYEKQEDRDTEFMQEGPL
jgi:hypothetical protein